MDAARLSLTYPLRSMWIVVDEPAQRALVERLFRHGNATADRHDDRGDFSRMAWAPTVESVVEHHVATHGVRPTVVATSARTCREPLAFATLRARIAGDEPVLLLVGKAWGLAPELLITADVQLAPIDAGTGFNHLSVRSAMAVLVDRLVG